MRKIGILTFHRAENYGAVLQAYALNKKLNCGNFECEIIDYRDSNIEKPYKFFFFSGKNAKIIIKDFIKGIVFFLYNIIRKKKFRRFYKKMRLSKNIKNIEELPKYDIYITGSDQVWNNDIVGSLSDIYTLNFNAQNAKKISYAASMGKSYIEEDKKKEYKEKISQIDYISVREYEAKVALRKIISKDIEVVLDPTLLMKKEDWENEIVHIRRENCKYILAYHISPEVEFFKIVNKLSEITGLKVIHFGKTNKGFKNVLKKATTSGPLEFVNLIKNAEYVIGTSFHAMVFSIIFNKKFWIIPHKKTSSRVINLLEKFDISERAVNSLEEFEKLDYDKEIDYEKVNKKLEEERKKSIDWLNNAINS